MKNKYISPEVEIQKFSFEDILAGTDDVQYAKDSLGENTAFDYGYETDDLETIM
ncbi:hypothetical protein [Ruminococcus sp.]